MVVKKIISTSRKTCKKHKSRRHSQVRWDHTNSACGTSVEVNTFARLKKRQSQFHFQTIMNAPSPYCQFTLHSAARSSTTHGIGTKMDSSGDTSMCCVKLIDAKKYEPKGAISMPIVSHLFDNGKHRGRSMCRCQPASREAKSADFCQAGPLRGPSPVRAMTL